MCTVYRINKQKTATSKIEQCMGWAPELFSLFTSSLLPPNQPLPKGFFLCLFSLCGRHGILKRKYDYWLIMILVMFSRHSPGAAPPSRGICAGCGGCGAGGGWARPRRAPAPSPPCWKIFVHTRIKIFMYPCLTCRGWPRAGCWRCCWAPRWSCRSVRTAAASAPRGSCETYDPSSIFGSQKLKRLS